MRPGTSPSSAAGASSSAWARRSARTSRIATPCPSARTRSAGWATTSVRCGPPSPRSPRARRPPTRARTTASPGCSPTSTPGPTRPRRRRRSTSAACSAGPARWPARWPTASSATPPTRTPATCESPACPPWPTVRARAGRDLEPESLRTGHRHPGHHRASRRRPGRERERQRRLLAFLYSTPAYGPPSSSTAGPSSGPACAT